MKFEIFSKLFNEAHQYKDIDMYVAERGWEDWMDDYADIDDDAPDASDIYDVLTEIYSLAHMNIKQMRSHLNLTFNEFSYRYSVASRTVQDWEYGKSKTPEYILKLVAYTIFMERGCTDEQD